MSFPIYLKFNGQKALEIHEGDIPYGIQTDKRITEKLINAHKPIQNKPNPIKRALEYQRLKEQGMSLSEIGKQHGISRVRVHQFLNLLTKNNRNVG